MTDDPSPEAPFCSFPGVPITLWPSLIAAAGPLRIFLVGGAVRDWLLHHVHLDPWRGLLDLDLVIEDCALHGQPASSARHERSSPAWQMVEHLVCTGEGLTVVSARPHGQFGTVELELDLDAPSSDGEGVASPSRLLLDVASARREAYPMPAENPVVCFGALEDDLARRDLTINAMALDLATGELLDPHGGQADLAAKRLCFLHPKSLQDDPTRLVRAARYAARLGFQLAPESSSQAAHTLESWPWSWRRGDSPQAAPPALGTRLRKELEVLLVRENWKIALQRLHEWGGFLLLDPLLQADHQWPRRLHWASRWSLPLMAAFIAAAEDPLALAERLQVPHRQHLILQQFLELQRRLACRALNEGAVARTPWQWCQLLEAPGLSPEAVALALACGVGPRRPLLRWWLRWRDLGPACSAQELMDAGVPKGPELGEQLRCSRKTRLEQERL
jgi:poly(A) polymerase